MNNTTTVTVGSGKAIHWGSDTGTMCGAAHRNGFFTEPKNVKAETATCKRCIKLMAAEVEEAHAAAIAEKDTRANLAALADSGVEAEQTWTSTDIAGENATVTSVSVTRLGVLVYYTITTGPRAGRRCGLPLDDFLGWFKREDATITEAHAEALAEDAQRRWDAERAEDLAPASKSFPAAVALDTWLEAGLVLVGPSTDTLYVFENWTGGTAVLTDLATGAMEYVAQADIVNWRYLPGAQLEEVPAEQVKAEDVVLFHAGGRYRVVEEVEHRRGTDLFSFSVLGNVVQFVRHAPEAVKRLAIPRG